MQSNKQVWGEEPAFCDMVAGGFHESKSVKVRYVSDVIFRDLESFPRNECSDKCHLCIDCNCFRPDRST